jgi:hypothetical protein
LVHVKSTTKEWNMCYVSEMMGRSAGLDCASSANDVKISAASGARLGGSASQHQFWDVFDLPGRPVDSLLQDLGQVWKTRGQPHIFALDLKLKSNGGRSVSCKFVPMEEPMDVATAAVPRPVQREEEWSSEEGRHYMVLMMIAP